MKQDDTHSRILYAASDVFVEKGFKGTTVRDICTAADANVAAVNYHFGDKKRLYGKVLTMWMNEFVETGEPTKGITADSSPEDRMRAYFRSGLKVCVHMTILTTSGVKERVNCSRLSLRMIRLRRSSNAMNVVCVKFCIQSWRRSSGLWMRSPFLKHVTWLPAC